MAQLTTEHTGLVAECKRLVAIAEAERKLLPIPDLPAYHALWHYTMNTQHGRWSGRNEVDSTVIAKLQSLIPEEHGDHSFTIHEIPLRVQITKTEGGAMWTILAKAKKPHGAIPRPLKAAMSKEVPLVTCGLAMSPEHRRGIWDNLILLSNDLRQVLAKVGIQSPAIATQMPESHPLLAVLVHDTAGAFNAATIANGGEGLVFPVNGGVVTINQLMMMLGDLERSIAWAVLGKL